jgi:KEOPS complex subunit Pcc1
MKAQAVIRLNFASTKQLQVVMQALQPETDTSSTHRSEVHMTTEGQNLVLDFRAKDTSALRASVNSYLRLIGVAMDLKKLAD